MACGVAKEVLVLEMSVSALEPAELLFLIKDVGRTTVTSSPMTSTSGLRKCFNATILARQAQSRRFPESDKQCIVNRRCHT